MLTEMNFWIFYATVATILWIPLSRMILKSVRGYNDLEESDYVFALFMGLIATVCWPLAFPMFGAYVLLQYIVQKEVEKEEELERVKTTLKAMNGA